MKFEFFLVADFYAGKEIRTDQIFSRCRSGIAGTGTQHDRGTSQGIKKSKTIFKPPFFRSGSKIAGRNGAKKRRSTAQRHRFWFPKIKNSTLKKISKKISEIGNNP